MTFKKKDDRLKLTSRKKHSPTKRFKSKNLMCKVGKESWILTSITSVLPYLYTTQTGQYLGKIYKYD